jgi:hypothetical protein
VNFFLDSGGGILLMTVVAGGLVVSATTLAATLTLALLVWALRPIGRLRRP